MHAADEVGEYAGVGEGRCEIATGTSTRERQRNCHPFSIRNFQVAAAEGVRLNVNRGFAIRNSPLIATIGLSIPAIDSGSRLADSFTIDGRRDGFVGAGLRPARVTRDS